MSKPSNVEHTHHICILGLGYIGLPTAVMFANHNFQVTGVDVNEQVIEQLRTGTPHIEEPNFFDLFRNVTGKSLTYETMPVPADTYIIAVPTPVHEDHSADLTYVIAATRAILPHLRPGNLIIVESTIPPQTTDITVTDILLESGWHVGENIYLAHCPERVIPGKIVHEIVHNARIVGGVNDVSTQKAADLYRSFVKGEVLETTAINAEMSKLMENTFRDVNIALANELVKISSVLHINPLEVIRLANHHPRVNILQPGPGVGGHCIAVDPYFIVEKAFHQTPLIQTAREINESMPSVVIEQIVRLTEGTGILKPKVAIFGIAYKGNVGDWRESPALTIIAGLQAKEIEVAVHDPLILNGERLATFELVTAEDAARDSDLLVVLADHEVFRQSLDEHLFRLMRRAIILDTKNFVRLPDASGAKLITFDRLFH
jgi:UDP-N-acetyl-D-mannosaminuronic acid dehydrogenase